VGAPPPPSGSWPGGPHPRFNGLAAVGAIGSDGTGLVIPPLLAATQPVFNRAAGRSWLAALPDLVRRTLDAWSLRVDGAPRSGVGALVLPVRRVDDGTAAVLKLQIVDDETRGEAVALRAWDGRGAVRLLAEDEAAGALLLERLDGDRSLDDVDDDIEALEILSALLARLTTLPAPPGLRHLRDIAQGMLDDVPAALAPLADEDDRRLLRRCADHVSELLPEPGDRLLHWDLHYQNVLAGTREPWLAIDPKPLAGDPGFDLLPALHNRWDDVVATGDVDRAVRRRFDLMTGALGLDRRRAVGWSLGRVLQNAIWDMADGSTKVDRMQVAIARALLDHPHT
jgi:streptomycin 6-kinase